MDTITNPTMRANDDLRARAIARLEHKREFWAHLAAYVLVNGGLVVIWAMTGAGFFWPVFPIIGWGIGLFFHGWDTFRGGPKEARIRREMDRLERE
ncbi:MAG TPA: 2TM domain-containing protein [Actinomycetota bacterium]|nr:2TM domain-containing protein [Actinomycetota bacterium]